MNKWIISSICLLLFANASCKKQKPALTSAAPKKEAIALAKYRNGKRLFLDNCHSCHHQSMSQGLTGPALGGVTTRYEKDWLYKFTRNSYQMYLDGDPVAVKLVEENHMMIMSSFQHLTDKELDAIYYFIEERYRETLKTSGKGQ